MPRHSQCPSGQDGTQQQCGNSLTNAASQPGGSPRNQSQQKWAYGHSLHASTVPLHRINVPVCHEHAQESIFKLFEQLFCGNTTPEDHSDIACPRGADGNIGLLKIRCTANTTAELQTAEDRGRGRRCNQRAGPGGGGPNVASGAPGGGLRLISMGPTPRKMPESLINHLTEVYDDGTEKTYSAASGLGPASLGSHQWPPSQRALRPMAV